MTNDIASKAISAPAETPTNNSARATLPNSNHHNNPLIQIWYTITHWWWGSVASDVDQDRVIERVAGESTTTGRYIFMICMSAGIAVLGLILSSPAVVIGAMLLSPLMGPIMGAGFALAIGDYKWLRESGNALILGTIVAVIFCAIIVILSPLQTVTSEIASRTRPNLFDLLVALFSALAGAYSMVRGREGTIVGVAIATALMPPLAVVGFGLATFNWTVFGGALMLFVTNLITIALSAAVVARLYGFRTRLSEQQSLFQSVGILIAFVLLAVPLAYSLKNIAWEANASRVISSYLEEQFDERARISSLEIDWDGKPIKVSATVLTPKFEAEAAKRSSRALTTRLGYPIEVSIDQFRVGTGAGEADAAQLAAAKAREQAIATEREITQLGERMALVAGVPAENVFIDRGQRRAVVKAQPLTGASLATYFELEERVARLEPEWTLMVEPPALALPDIAMANGEPTVASKRQLELIIWAAKRVDAPIGINGSIQDVDMVLTYLQSAGVDAVRKARLPSRPGTISSVWLAPNEAIDAKPQANSTTVP